MTALPSRSTIGILGGGQLGRMLAMAAAQLGYRCHIYAPEKTSIAAEVAAEWTRGDYDDIAALRKFAASVDVVTYEFENIHHAPLVALSEEAILRPSVQALEIAQDRKAEKSFVGSLGGRTAPWASVNSRDELDAALSKIGAPAILKTRRLGYDGKGQARIRKSEDADAAWKTISGQPAIMEGFVRFDREFSVILARAADGGVHYWDCPDNEHDHGILALSTVPAGPTVAAQAQEAMALARKVADALDYVGVLTLEFFAGEDGPVFNEMAPRVHNSGHWTIEGAITSQFENHIRAICGLPLGETSLAATRVEMRNLIGNDVEDAEKILADPSNHLHLYGKGEGRPGRKMGHVTRLFL
ncbi:5-(carboxyamino)imidazole ribonucleotide synthase [Rhizorhapis suberifaciens]|uniref:N5-carboxyaminoimidazole ribonucleotide synthase n=1 Tax=Rhizorhapis suberifaciens TaxID=13656 RepID=A0A840HT86_9SPHN|nr:5-(carboxyamino)imidazole ribonucleotide synthase [Rhizorhapis suberifaciens]MBB4641392.1 5-(carboxyamino)imidazole ribonucleotide synthase [Rhizorhapis suberifaciens]